MLVTSLTIPDIKIIELDQHQDDRGYFVETYRKSDFQKAIGAPVEFVQFNRSYSKSKYTVRGLHCQRAPHEQGKLLQCTRGRIVDVAVDIRKTSPTFGQFAKTELDAKNCQQLWVPSGFLHGFVTLEPNTEVEYKCTDYFEPSYACDVYFNDSELGIDWGFDTSLAVLSEKDEKASGFKDFAASL